MEGVEGAGLNEHVKGVEDKISFKKKKEILCKVQVDIYEQSTEVYYQSICTLFLPTVSVWDARPDSTLAVARAQGQGCAPVGPLEAASLGP